jgi:hypothetical protein
MVGLVVMWKGVEVVGVGDVLRCVGGVVLQFSLPHGMLQDISPHVFHMLDFSCIFIVFFIHMFLS